MNSNGAQWATTKITLSNPVQKRFIATVGEDRPPVKIIVTETLDDTIENFEVKPRKPRKADLSKCIKDRDAVNSINNAKEPKTTGPEQFIYLGDTEGLDLEGTEFQTSFSLKRFSSDEQTKNGEEVRWRLFE